MRKISISLLILLVFVLLASFALAACETTGTTPQPTAAPKTQPPATPMATPLTPYPAPATYAYPTP